MMHVQAGLHPSIPSLVAVCPRVESKASYANLWWNRLTKQLDRWTERVREESKLKELFQVDLKQSRTTLLLQHDSARTQLVQPLLLFDVTGVGFQLKQRMFDHTLSFEVRSVSVTDVGCP